MNNVYFDSKLLHNWHVVLIKLCDVSGFQRFNSIRVIKFPKFLIIEFE